MTISLSLKKIGAMFRVPILVALGAWLVCCSVPCSAAKFFWIDAVASNHSLLREELTKRGFTESTSSHRFDFKWTYSKDRLDYHREDQILNHFSTFDEVGTKTGMLRGLRRLLHNGEPIFDYFPRAYNLKSGEDANALERTLFLQDFQRLKGQYEDTCTPTAETRSTSVPLPPLQPLIDGTRNIWIVKPGEQARGVGIELFNDADALLTFVDSHPAGSTFIVQKYIERPMTISGKKFDVRQFVLVTSLDPLVIYLFDDCYLRFASEDYDVSTADSIQNRFKHLTNHQVQKDSPAFHSTGIEGNQWKCSQFRDYLETHLNISKDEWCRSIDHAIRRAIIGSLKSWPPAGHRDYSFELLGFDIIFVQSESDMANANSTPPPSDTTQCVDGECHVSAPKDEQPSGISAQPSSPIVPYVLEINTNPGLHLLTDTVRDHHRRAVSGLLDVVLGERFRWTAKNAAKAQYDVDKCGIPTKSGWRMIYKGAKLKKDHNGIPVSLRPHEALNRELGKPIRYVGSREAQPSKAMMHNDHANIPW